MSELHKSDAASSSDALAAPSVAEATPEAQPLLCAQALACIQDSFASLRTQMRTQAENLTYDERLAATAWVFEKLVEHGQEQGSFRYLIYDRLGFSADAYAVLLMAGGMTLSNALVLLESDNLEPTWLTELDRLANSSPMAPHPTLKRHDGEPVWFPTEERSALFSATWAARNLLEAYCTQSRRLEHLSARVDELESRAAVAESD